MGALVNSGYDKYSVDLSILKSMMIKHYNSRTAQTENNSELELVKIELELKNTKALSQVKSPSITLNTAVFVNNIHQV